MKIVLDVEEMSDDELRERITELRKDVTYVEEYHALKRQQESEAKSAKTNVQGDQKSKSAGRPRKSLLDDVFEDF